MKERLLFFVIMCVLLFSITGCKNKNTKLDYNNGNSNINENINDTREILELENYYEDPDPDAGVIPYEDENLVITKNINLNNVELSERLFIPYNGEKELDVFTKYIKENMNIEINNKWKVIIHYYNNEKTAGMVRFQYFIGEIMTNRVISFGLENGNFNTLSYKCLDGKIDEDDLINRVKLFKGKYIQGTRKLEAGEIFVEARTKYVYYINADKLVYSYAYFFKYGIGVINNDWGTIRLIDENGNALSLK